MKFILGSGIVGAISSFYFRDYMVLSKGRGQDSIRIGPKIIRSTEYTDSLIGKINSRLIEFDLNPIKMKSFNCAYSTKGKITEKLSDENIVEYINKTRSKSDGTVNIDSFKSSALNDGLTSIKGYYMDEVYNALTSRRDFRTRRLFMKIDRIDSKKHVVEGVNPSFNDIKLSFNYSHLVNTLPAHLFNSFLLKDPLKKDNSSEINIYIVKSKELFDKLGKYDFIYYLDKNIPYYRITKIGNNILSIESKKLFFTRNVLKERHIVLKTIKLPFGKISDDVSVKNRINVKHIGRYANNDNSLRVHDIIELFEKEEIEV